MIEDATRRLALAWIVSVEGGYVHDPDDPGGETNHGISKRSYPDLDIRSLTAEAAREIYRRDYWDRHRCGEIASFSPALALAYFDTCVNSGGARAAALLSSTLRISQQSGTTDYLLLEARTAALAWRAISVVERFLFHRLLFLSRLKTARKFLSGWSNRIRQLYEACRVLED